MKGYEHDGRHPSVLNNHIFKNLPLLDKISGKQAENREQTEIIPFNIFKTATRPHKEIIYLVLMCTTIAIKTDKHRPVVSQYADHSCPVTNIQHNKHVCLLPASAHSRWKKKKIVQTNRFESKRAGQQHFLSSHHDKGKMFQ